MSNNNMNTPPEGRAKALCTSVQKGVQPKLGAQTVYECQLPGYGKIALFSLDSNPNGVLRNVKPYDGKDAGPSIVNIETVHREKLDLKTGRATKTVVHNAILSEEELHNILS